MAEAHIKADLAVPAIPGPMPKGHCRDGSHDKVPVTPILGGTLKKEPEPAAAPICQSEWRRYKGDDLLKCVQIKELAVKNAILALNKIQETLKLHLASNVSCQPRIEKIRTILARRKEFQILVGFLGVTGSGKTTLINALLGIPNLLPSSPERACTAVVVEISFNESNDPESLYRAEIVYVTVDEWREELEQIFTDIQAPSEDEDADDREPDLERRDRIKETFDKLKCVYPHIKSLEKLKSTSVDDLLAHFGIQDVLSSTKKIANHQKSNFSDSIKGHIDGNTDGNISAHWPLIKLVKVFVKSPFLEHGSNSDNNAARSAVAEKYQKELSVTCIVGEAKRGISEKNAHDLLEKVTKRNLQLDGLYNSESLCFVLSQIDRNFDVPAYIKSHPDLDADCAEDTNHVTMCINLLESRKDEDFAVSNSHKNNTKLARNLSGQIKKLKERINERPNSPALLGCLELQRKRKADDMCVVSELSDTSPEQVILLRELHTLQKQHSDVKILLQKEAKLLVALGRRIESLELARFHAISELKLFCVAATLYLRYKATTKRVAGFPNREDTQISALRDWLVGTTLSTRERNAQAFLEDVETFVESLQPWIDDKYGNIKMSAELRAFWESDLENKVKELDERFSELSLTTTNTLKELVQTEFYSKVAAAKKSAAFDAKTTATLWAKGLQWSTHRSVNQHRGNWKDSRNREHKWNAELVVDFTNSLVKPWNNTFFHKFPIEQATYVANGKQLLMDFESTTIDKGTCLDVSDGIDILKDHIIRTEALLQSQTAVVFNGITKTVRKAHKKAVPAVAQFLGPMYATCAAESGKGHYSRNKATHQSFMKQNGGDMHHAGSSAVQAAIDKLLDGLPSKFETSYSAVSEQIKEEIKHFFDQNTSSGTQNSTRKTVSNAKAKLQQDLLPNLENLSKSWNSAVPAQVDLENVGFNDEVDLDDLEFFDVEKLKEQDDDDVSEYEEE